MIHMTFSQDDDNNRNAKKVVSRVYLLLCKYTLLINLGVCILTAILRSCTYSLSNYIGLRYSDQRVFTFSRNCHACRPVTLITVFLPLSDNTKYNDDV